MRAILNIQKQLMPDLLDVMKKRYTILRHIAASRLIGRRTLAASLNMTERVLRAEADFLKEQGLVDIDPAGIRLTEAGQKVLDEMEPMAKELFGLSELEEKIRDTFHISQVIIVPGDSDTSPYTKKEMGRAGASALRRYVSQETVIAVTGGSTMAEVATHLSPTTALKGSWFVPARGGLGESVEFQANTIASTMAKKTGGQYRLLHVPDHLGEEAYQSLIQEPNIRELIEVIRSARIVLHGIGEANVMAKRRRADEATFSALAREGALAEAFGYYFDRDGVVVHKMPTVGLRLEDIQQTETVIAVAGGKSKGESIASVLRFGHEDVLVTDEAAAREMLNYT
ncbi:sugar-binding domain-containing protein [Paenibacillus aurantius]|uniref:Sugar-binding domain-containing protein n=1 Tax=Paenibacillus aurantius TaxID=2918900 RepID=A0AA96LDE9_9BACL|nr:sugar-binding domain-containing protein [Paenibacillus aurantius]WNQ11013.1 sugar-binding domain-containing protein [Paenibacillus aurantius]